MSDKGIVCVGLLSFFYRQSRFIVKYWDIITNALVIFIDYCYILASVVNVFHIIIHLSPQHTVRYSMIKLFVQGHAAQWPSWIICDIE
jgi:hypothetical protein